MRKFGLKGRLRTFKGRGPSGDLPAPAVANQTLTFGALTLEDAGGVAPTNTGGSITSASIDSGDASGHFQIATDGTITPTAAGEAAGLSGPYTLGCTFTNSAGSDTATITVNTEADTYSVTPETDGLETEFDAALDAITSTGGKTVKFRPGTHLVPRDPNAFSSRAFAAEVVITSHDTDNQVILDCIESGASSGVKWRGAENIKLYKLKVKGDFVAADHTTDSKVITLSGDVDGLVIDECELYSNILDVGFGDHLRLIDGEGITNFTGSGFTLKNSTLHGAARLLILTSGAGTVLIENNEFYNFGFDGIVFGSLSDLTIRWNDIHSRYASPDAPEHADAIQGVCGSGLSGAQIYGNRAIPKRTDGVTIKETMQVIFIDDIDNQMATNVDIFANVGYSTNQQGVWVYNSDGGSVDQNTLVAFEGEGSSSGPYISFGSQTPSGTIQNNEAHDNVTRLVSGTVAADENNVLAQEGTNYAALFDGDGSGGFAPTTISEMMTIFAPKAGGALDTAVPKVGAIGDYVDFDGFAPTVGRAPTWDIPRRNTVAAFTITDLTGQTSDTVVTSSATQITDIDKSDGTASVNGALVQVSGGRSPEFRITTDSGGSTVVTDWTSTPAIIDQGEYLWVRDTSSASAGTTTNVTVEVGAQSDTWSITTAAALALIQTTTHSDQSFNTSQDLAIPAGVANGSTLVAVMRTGALPTITVPTGWSLVSSEETDTGFYVYKKTADGTEGGTTVTWTTNSANKSCFAFAEIDASLGEVEVSFAAASSDPPSRTHTGGSAATVWLAVVTERKNSGEVTAPPTGYTSATPLTVESTASNSTNSAEVLLGAAYLESTAETEDPGAFTQSSSATGVQAATISVR